MVAPEFFEIYNKYVPRWFKVIRWREFAHRQVENWKFTIPCVIAPTAYILCVFQSPYPMYLCIKQPKTDEERLAIKRDSLYSPYQRDWDMGQWNHEQPPIIDLWKRRKNYPQYYEGKYDGYRRDFVSYQAPTIKGSGIIPDSEQKKSK